MSVISSGVQTPPAGSAAVSMATLAQMTRTTFVSTLIQMLTSASSTSRRLFLFTPLNHTLTSLSCGAVGKACRASGTGVSGSVCNSGTCGVSCSRGYYPSADGKSCGTNNTPANCGTQGKCPVPLNGSATCSSGNCGISCNDGYTASGSTCVATSTDVNNCGSIGKKCVAPSNGAATCSNG